LTTWTLWITGLPGSGKSTLVHELWKKARDKDVMSQILAVDDLRKVMTPIPTYSESERARVYATMVYIAKLLNKNGINVIIDATGNRRCYRDHARQTLDKFVLVYAKCPLEICINREKHRHYTFGAPKRVYEKGLEGKSVTVPGINVPYEEPANADLVLRTDRQTVDECGKLLLCLVLDVSNE
jgi:adenylylsulfate kinase